MGVLGGWTICGLNIFDSLDYLTANIMLPVGGLLTCLFVGWRLDRQVLRAHSPTTEPCPSASTGSFWCCCATSAR